MAPSARRLRRPWPALAALLVLAGFSIVHAFWFRPDARRYQRVLQQANDMGMGLDPAKSPPLPSPQVYTLLSRNSLRAAVAETQGNSGALTAAMLENLTRIASRRGMEVVSTEQGQVTQLKNSVQVRAHLRLRGRYASFVGFLDDLARSGTLFAVDRFTLESGQGRNQNLELWMSQYILKQSETAR